MPFHSEDCIHKLIRSKLDYAAPVWQPWLSATNLSYIDRLENRFLWLIIVQLVSTLLEALRLEAVFWSNYTFSNGLILKAREKALRRTNHHPKYVALSADIPQRLQNCCSFYREANNLSILLSAELGHCQTTNHFPSPPWQLSPTRKKQISPSVCVIAESGWWHWFKTLMQSHTRYIIPAWLHHLQQ